MGCTALRPPAAQATTSVTQPVLNTKRTDSGIPIYQTNPTPTSIRKSPINGEGGDENRHSKVKQHPAVFTKGYSKDLKIDRPKVPKTYEEQESILKVLDSCYVFASATEEQKEELSCYMFKFEVDVNQTVVNIGEFGDNFYAIQKGTFEFYVDGQLITRRSGCSREPFFGELALLYNSPRQATAVCTSVLNESANNSPHSTVHHQQQQQQLNIGGKAILWAIDRDTFRQVLAISNEQQREEKRLAVQSISFLKDALSEEQLNRVIESVNLFQFHTGQRIVRKGDKGDVCYFIKQGTVMCTRIGPDGAGELELGPGSYFGERALLLDEPRAADVTATSDVVAMALDRKSFDELLGPLRSVMDDNMKERVVESLPILRELNPRLRQEVMADFELETFRVGDRIVTAGEKKCDKFYIVRAGAVKVLEQVENEDPKTGNEIAELKEGDWFGEMALLNDEPRVATCVAATPRVECFVLRRATFQSISAESKILAATSEHRRQVNVKRRMSDTQLSEDTPQRRSNLGGLLSVEKVTNAPTLNEIEKLKILGKGTFGTVYLVTSKSDKQQQPQKYYALKAMNKHHLVRCEQKNNVVNEKKILSQCDSHPFVLQLHTTYQDRDALYMLLEFVQGGELFSIMQAKFRFPMYPTFFYSACIVDVFEHIHSLNVVYRDLKPENVLIDKFGYVKLADFGFAKRIMDKTYTLCGTPEYLAPEVVLGNGHDKGVDYWGIGILIYEMLVGMSPFADEYDEDQHVVCNNIVKGRVAYDKLIRAIADTESKPDPFWSIPPSLARTASSTGPATPISTKLLRRPTPPVQGSLPVEDLIKKLLIKSPVQRLGNLKDGAKDVKRHSFYCDIQDWDDLRTRKVPAPFVPTLKSETDTSRFDAFEPDAAWPVYKGSQDWCEGF